MTLVRCRKLVEPIGALAPRYTVQGCIGGRSMVTCVKLTDSGFERSLPRQKDRTSTTRPSGWYF